MMYRVYDDRTNETLFTSNDKFDCTTFIFMEIGEDSDDFEHVWVEKVEREGA